MRKTVLSTVAAAVLLSLFGSQATPAAPESDSKPLAVVSLAGYDSLMGNVELAGKLAGRPKLAGALQGMLTVATQGKGLAGVDTKRPWGIVIQSAGPMPKGYAFLPVDDLEVFHEVVKPLVKEVQELDGGVYKVQGKRPYEQAYVEHKSGRWLVVCDTAEGLTRVPDDPSDVLGDLPEQYAVAVRVSLGDVPAEVREQLIAEIKKQAAKDLQKRPGENDHEYAIRKTIGGQFLEVFLAVVRDLESVTLGGSLDNGGQGAILELGMTARKGSKTAKALAGLAEAETAFPGFVLPDAILSGHGAGSCPFAKSADLGGLFASLRTAAFEGIDAEESEDRAKLGKEIVGGLLDVVQDTLATGRVDGAGSLILRPQSATLVAARYVASGPDLEEVLEKIVRAVREERPDLVDRLLTVNAAEVEGVRLHKLSVPVPRGMKNRDQIVALVGHPAEVVVGIGQQAVYLAAGKNAMETLQKAIRESAAGSSGGLPPMEISVALGELAKFIAETGPGKAQRQASKVLAALEGAAGKDHVKLAAVPVEGGMKLRLEMEQGVLGMIEAMHGK
ncbi:MAG: hypothetical protein ACYTG0_09745 [Planctomycetota bacterium]